MLKAITCAFLCALLVSSVSATPVQFTWRAEVDNIPNSTPIPGVVPGAEVVVQVVVDNGSSSLDSQSWFLTDLVSVHLKTGSYEADYIDDFIPVGSQPVFETNSSGEMTSVLFVGTAPSLINSDVFGVGGSVRLNNNTIRDYDNRVGYLSKRLVGPSNNLDGWDTHPTIVPEPSALTLFFLIGFFGLRFRCPA